MKLFIAVMFLCQNGTCGFLQSEEFFYSEKECQVVLQSGMADLKARGVVVQGACLDIDTKRGS